jgi:hypothetical protein
MPLQGSPNNPYRNESGTSFAAPMITGTVAWLNSVVCKTYLNLMQRNPDSALALMRGWILGSVEKNASLTSKTVTGGVLQTFGAWSKMDAWCMANEPTYNDSQERWIPLMLYPNPGDGHSCAFQGPEGMKFNAILCDATGRMLWQGTFVSNQEVTTNVALSSGCYFWHIESIGKKWNLPWVVR